MIVANIKIDAPAKINLSLDVLRKRQDGYHDLLMVMQTINLFDIIEINVTSSKNKQEVPRFSIKSNRAFLPLDGRNLALAAAVLFFTKIGAHHLGADIKLTKNIPVCAGLGGGSADAAAVLRALSALYPVQEDKLREWALELGSDVPFCLVGGTMLAEGRGEILTPLTPIPECFVVLTKPDIFVSTRASFNALDSLRLKYHPDTKTLIKALECADLGKMARYMFNVFEEPLASEHKLIGGIRGILINYGALGAVMSGSGPTMLGIFDKEEWALRALKKLKEEHEETFIVKTRSGRHKMEFNKIYSS